MNCKITQKVICILICIALLANIRETSAQEMSEAEAEMRRLFPDYVTMWEQHMRQSTRKRDVVTETLNYQRLTQAARNLLFLPRQAAQTAMLKGASSSGSGGKLGLLTLNATCELHAMAFFLGVLAQPQAVWAVQMFDAWGKPPPGVTQGALKWPGAYEQCYKIVQGDPELANPPASGIYCNGVLNMKATPALPISRADFGVCMPDTCTPQDFGAIVNMLLLSMNRTETVGIGCYPKVDGTLDTKAKWALAVCVLLLFCIVTGTALDVVLVQWPKWQDEKLATSDITTNAASISVDESLPLMGKKSAVRSRPVEVGKLGKFFLAFSLWTNGSKLLSTHQPPGSINSIHGIRFFSMTWVTLGHVWGAVKPYSRNGIPYEQALIKRWTFQAISNATPSVDSFFCISGLLVAYLTLKEMTKKNTWKINWFMFYFHRFWRLTPAYMLVIMVDTCFTNYWGEGPFWGPKDPGGVINCQRNWWTNLLYINNLVNSDAQCLGQTWYMANDMQFYILSPLVFVPYFFSTVAGLIVSALFLLGTAIPPAIVVMNEYFPPATYVQIEGEYKVTENSFSYMYVKPWNRMGSYVVGLMAGYLLHRLQGKLRINRYLNLLIWAVATTVALLILYGFSHAVQGHPVTLRESAFYTAVHRQAWAACVAWVVIACHTGNGGFVNTLLSWKGLIPLSRLTYCIFLLHFMIINIYLRNQQDLFYMNDMTMTSFFIVVLVYTYMASFVCSLAFEAPMMGLEKVFFHPAQKPQEKKPFSDQIANGLATNGTAKVGNKLNYGITSDIKPPPYQKSSF